MTYVVETAGSVARGVYRFAYENRADKVHDPGHGEEDSAKRAGEGEERIHGHAEDELR